VFFLFQCYISLIPAERNTVTSQSERSKDIFFLIVAPFNDLVRSARNTEEMLKRKVDATIVAKLKDTIEEVGGIDELFELGRETYSRNEEGETPGEAFRRRTEDIKAFLEKIGVLAE
jgi:hypothetical protein